MITTQPDLADLVESLIVPRRAKAVAFHAGKHETSSMEDFSWGVANRGVSIRVGRNVPVDKCGYYEDRRPASNLDPYVVCRLLVESALIGK